MANLQNKINLKKAKAKAKAKEYYYSFLPYAFSKIKI